MSIDDGGMAFPRIHDGLAKNEGMSLLDWFAGQALAGMMAARPKLGPLTEEEFDTSMANIAYMLAGKMVAEKRRMEAQK